MELVVEIYTLTKDFPTEEKYGLASQMKRAAVSIPSNIAEGRRRGSRKDFGHFLLIAYASGAELETQLEITKRLHLCKEGAYFNSDALLGEIMKMLNVMLTKLKSEQPNQLIS